MRTRYSLTLLAVAVAALVAVAARAAPAAAVKDESSRLAEIVKARKVPGLVACRIDGLTVTRLGAAGLRRRGGAEPLLATDRMHLGSCTKAMTATLCAMLVKDGKLAWTSTLGSVFPERAKAMGAAWRDVPLEAFLRNRGGAPADLDADGLWARLWAFDGTPLDARLAMLDGVVKRPPVAAPGEKYVYSNAGFSLAGAMAERAAKSPWEKLMQTRVFDALTLPGAGFGAPGAETARGKKVVVDEPRGHRAGLPVEPGPAADNPPAIAPAAAVHMPISEWARFAALHARRGRGYGDAFEKLDWAALHDPPKGADYAMGWNVGTRPWAKGPGEADMGRVLTHTGSNTMWFCAVWIAPERDFAVLACCNEGGDAGAAACDDAVAGMLAD